MLNFFRNLLKPQLKEEVLIEPVVVEDVVEPTDPIEPDEKDIGDDHEYLGTFFISLITGNQFIADTYLLNDGNHLTYCFENPLSIHEELYDGGSNYILYPYCPFLKDPYVFISESDCIIMEEINEDMIKLYKEVIKETENDNSIKGKNNKKKEMTTLLTESSESENKPKKSTVVNVDFGKNKSRPTEEPDNNQDDDPLPPRSA